MFNFSFYLYTLATTTSTTSILQLPLGRYLHVCCIMYSISISEDGCSIQSRSITLCIACISLCLCCVYPHQVYYPIVVFNFVHAFFVHFYIRWEDWRSSFRYRYHYLKIDMLLIYLIIPPKQ